MDVKEVSTATNVLLRQLPQRPGRYGPNIGGLVLIELGMNGVSTFEWNAVTGCDACAVLACRSLSPVRSPPYHYEK